MELLISVLSAVFWGALVLSLLVVVHEGAHFVAARFFDMRVTEFFLGLPCRFKFSWKSKRFGTEFGVTPFLLGGYNRICGMEAESDELVAPALAIIQREGRVSFDDLGKELGVDSDRTMGILVYLMDIGSIQPYYDPEKDEHPWQKQWPETFETLQRDGKLLTEYDSEHDFTVQPYTKAGEPRPIEDANAFLVQEESHTYEGKGPVARIITLAAGPLINIVLAFVLMVGALMSTEYVQYVNTNVLGGVYDDSLAAAAGLREGDEILQIGSYPVKDWDTLADAIDKCLEAGEDFRVAYLRNGETFETTVDLPENEEATLLGVSAPTEAYHYSFSEASHVALRYMGFVGRTVAKIVQPTHTMEVVGQSSSIVGISAMASEAAKSSVSDFVLFAAAISLSLGYMNLLPIPPLDGGKILIELVQVAIRRPLSTKAKNAISYVGLAFFLFIFIFALRNDIMRLMGLM